MGKVDIWMPVYIGDYLRDTEELTGPEHGAYLLLLMHYWQKDGIIGSDIGRLARVCRSDEETARFILGYYFTLEGGNYKNKRADEEMGKAKSRRSSAENNGRKGGRPPKNNPQETARLSSGFNPLTGTKPERNPQESSSSSSSSSQDIKNTSSATPPKPEQDESFKTFYDAYPRKEARGQALKAYKAARRKGITAETILERLETYKARLDRDGTDRKYMRLPATFLNNLDDYECAEPVKPAAPPDREIETVTVPPEIMAAILRSQQPVNKTGGDREPDER